MIRLEAPFSEEKIRGLQVGDMVLISGKLYTGRDAVHKYLHEGNPSPVPLDGQIIYHCGPVVVKQDGKYVVKAAGPTTSIREEPYQHELIAQGLRGVIGKGGMGAKTLQACQKYGAVYLHAVGGAAQVLAERIVEVTNVYLLEQFGSPEAIWELSVQDFPVVVTMDAHGRSLHQEILDHSIAKLKELDSQRG